MASRWMQPKLDKMARDAKAKSVPGSHHGGHTVTTSNRVTSEVALLVARYCGVVTVCKPGRQLIPQGKGKRQHNAPFKLEVWGGRNDRRGPERKNSGIMNDRNEVLAMATQPSTLIRNGVVVA